MALIQDNKGWTHVDWSLNGVTPDMIDWHWANLEKTFFLWHPGQHLEFRWEIAPTQEKFIGAVHAAPQTRKGGIRKTPIIRYEDVSTLPQEVQELIVYNHVCVVAGLDLSQESDMRIAPVKGYRVHQWQSSDWGVIGRSSAVELNISNPETVRIEGELWAAHASEECGNWEVFLPQLYQLWQAVPACPIHLKKCLRVSWENGLHYESLQESL